MRVLTFAQLGPEKGIPHCRDHVRRLVRAGKFPAPIQLSENKIAWLKAEIDAMIAARAEERNKKPIDARRREQAAPKRLSGRPRKIPPRAEAASRPGAPLAAAGVEIAAWHGPSPPKPMPITRTLPNEPRAPKPQSCRPDDVRFGQDRRLRRRKVRG